MQRLHPAVVGIVPVFAGSALLAFALGVPPGTRPLPTASPASFRGVSTRSGWPRSLGLRGVLAALSLLLAATEIVLLRRADPGDGAIAAWLAAAATALIAAVRADRERGTSLGSPFRGGWEWAAVITMAGAALWLVGHDLSSWRWSGTPDEGAFFGGAMGVIRGQVRTFPLSEDGVFGFHPLLSTYYQVLFMHVFGMDVFGWRLSSAFAFAISLPFVYLLMREIHGRGAALNAVILFGTAQLAVGYSHFGYNNVQVYPIVTGSLALFAWSLRRRSLLGYFLTGGILGLGFFTYDTARFGVVLIPLLAWALGGWRRFWGDRAAVGALVAGLILVALPMLLQLDESVPRMLRLAGLMDSTSPQVAGAWRVPALPSAVDIGWQWLLAIFHGVWSESGHFQTVPIVDPFSLALSIAGLCLGGAAIALGRRDFLAPAYLLSAFAVGAVSPYPQPALTRVLFLSPFTAMLAGATLDWGLWRARQVLDAPRAVGRLGAAVLAAAVVWNVAMLNYNVYGRFYGYGDGTTTELLRIVEQLPDSCRIVYIQAGDSFMIGADNFIDAYGMRNRSKYICPYTDEVPHLLAHLRPPFVVLYQLSSPPQKRAVERVLTLRFPGRYWRTSSPGEPWSLRYFYVP